MTTDERERIRAAVSKTPKTVWEFWPFFVLIIFLVVGILVVGSLIFYFERRAPDLEMLFKNGKSIVRVWDSQMIREAVIVTAMSFVVTFMLFIYLARIAFKYATLLKMAAKELGIDEAQEWAGKSR
jgi:hypothetical protein